MNELEKRRSLLQVLCRVREQYGKLHAIGQWLKVHNEGWAVRVLQASCRRAAQQMGRLGQQLAAQNGHYAGQFGTRAVPTAPVFELLDGAGGARPKGYFARAIWGLQGAVDGGEGAPGTGGVWRASLEGVLRAEFCRQHLALGEGGAVVVRAVDGGRIELEVVGEFVVELTLVPCAGEGHAWFVLRVHAPALGPAYDAVLTALFQGRCAAAHDPARFLAVLVGLCREYVEGYFFEKLRVQFQQVAHLYGRGICRVDATSADHVEVQLWFEGERCVVHRQGARSCGLGGPLRATLSVDANAAAGLICGLFYGGAFWARLQGHLEGLARAGLLAGLAWVSRECVEVCLFDGLSARLGLSPFCTRATVCGAQAPLLRDFADSLPLLDADVAAGQLARARAGFFQHAVLAGTGLVLLSSTATPAHEVLLARRGADRHGLSVRLGFALDGSVSFRACQLVERQHHDGVLQLQLEDCVEAGAGSVPCPARFADLLAAAEAWLDGAEGALADSSFRKRMAGVGLPGVAIDDRQWLVRGLGYPPALQRLVVRTAGAGCELVVGNAMLEELHVVIGAVEQVRDGVHSVIRLFELHQVLLLPSCPLQVSAFDGLGVSMACRAAPSRAASVKLNDACQLELACWVPDAAALTAALNLPGLNVYAWLDALHRLLMDAEELGDADSAWLSEAFF